MQANRRRDAVLPILASALVWTLALVPLSCTGSHPNALTKVRVRLDWTPGSEHSFLYLATKKGFFAGSGLDLQIEPGEGSTVSAKLVASGDVDFALCSGDSALIARTQGLPLVVLAVFYPRTPTSIYSLREKNIVHPKDLYGKRYGATLASTTYQQFVAFSNLVGLDTAKIKVLPSPGRVEELLNDVVDAQGGYTYLQPVQLETAGHPVNEIRLVDYGMRSYSMSLICSEKTFRTRRDLVKAFTAATMKGFALMLKDPETALGAFADSKLMSDARFERVKLQKVIAFLAEDPVTPLGSQTPQGWKQTQDFLLQQHIIDKQIPLDGFYTNEFIPK